MHDIDQTGRSSIPGPDEQLTPRTTISEIVSYRDAAIAKMRTAVDMIAAGHALADESASLAQRAHGAAVFTMADRSQTNAYSRIFQHFDVDESLEAYRKQIDARVWMNLIVLTGMDRMMDKTARDEFYKELCGEVLEISIENTYTTFKKLTGDAGLIFQRGLARAFSGLDRRFKSHDAFSIGSRIILTNVFNGDGGWNYHSRMRDTLADIERVFAVLDGSAPDPRALERAISIDRPGWGARQSVTTSTFFKFRVFKNGNCHLWFTRDDLVEKANLTLADYYGEVLPDAVPRDDPEDELRSKTGALSKDLAFYPTPEPVISRVLDSVHIGEDSIVLEPSAGMGGIAEAVLALGAAVWAVEVSPERYRYLQSLCEHRHRRLHTMHANFLRLQADDRYTHVIMNPPFSGTHWMEHVVHAFGFLASGGTLVAILPISAELGTSKKHKAFREWATKRRGCSWGQLFKDLPPESFAASGTKISTVILTLHRQRSV